MPEQVFPPTKYALPGNGPNRRQYFRSTPSLPIGPIRFFPVPFVPSSAASGRLNRVVSRSHPGPELIPLPRLTRPCGTVAAPHSGAWHYCLLLRCDRGLRECHGLRSTPKVLPWVRRRYRKYSTVFPLQTPLPCRCRKPPRDSTELPKCVHMTNLPSINQRRIYLQRQVGGSTKFLLVS